MEKFIKPRLLTQREQDRKKFWQAVGLCALTAAIFFLPFYILDGGFFHYAGDFNSQQISFYRYMNGFVKGAGYPDSAFAGAPHNTFSWATDLGSGVMNAYSFYLYGSPFFWLSVLLPHTFIWEETNVLLTSGNPMLVVRNNSNRFKAPTIVTYR